MKLLCVFLILGLRLNLHAETLKVTVLELPSQKGKVLYLLFQNEDGFPDKKANSIRSGSLDLNNGNEFEIKDLPIGNYALSLIHDENENDKLDTNFIGIPKEAFGFSNDPKVYFGAPSFEKTSFPFTNDQNLIVKMKSM